MIINVGHIPDSEFKTTLSELSKTYSRVTMNISEFTKLLITPNPEENCNIFDPETRRDVLAIGRYGSIDDMTIYVSCDITPGKIEVE